MARVDSRLPTLLRAVHSRISDQVLGANDSLVIISDDPDSTPPMPGDVWWVVSPAPSGQFTENFGGGSVESAEVQTAFIVTVHSIIQQDEPGRGEEMFLDPNFGIFEKMSPVLEALSGHDLLDPDGNQILSQPIFPADYQWHRNSRTHSSVQMGFTVVFVLEYT